MAETLVGRSFFPHLKNTGQDLFLGVVSQSLTEGESLHFSPKVVSHSSFHAKEREMRLSHKERLQRFYACFSNDDQVLVLINADPDAMSSAIAIKRLLWRRVFSVTISHVNDIQRPDNLSMVRFLGIDMIHFRDLPNWRYSKVVLVDSQPDHHECFGMFRPNVIIDHHPESCVVGDYCDIRPDYGATASIMTEYLKAANIKPSSKLATALYYGIKTDTAGFLRKTLMEDLKAFQYLFRHINAQLERRIETTEIPVETLDFFSKALKNRQIKDDCCYAHLGHVINPDICVQVADFFLRVESITWSVVSGIYENSLVIILRNNGIPRSAGSVASTAFGKIGSAGGHKAAARAEITVPALKGIVNTRKQSAIASWVLKEILKHIHPKKRKKKSS